MICFGPRKWYIILLIKPHPLWWYGGILTGSSAMMVPLCLYYRPDDVASHVDDMLCDSCWCVDVPGTSFLSKTLSPLSYISFWQPRNDISTAGWSRFHYHVSYYYWISLIFSGWMVGVAAAVSSLSTYLEVHSHTNFCEASLFLSFLLDDNQQ